MAGPVACSPATICTQPDYKRGPHPPAPVGFLPKPQPPRRPPDCWRAADGGGLADNCAGSECRRPSLPDFDCCQNVAGQCAVRQ